MRPLHPSLENRARALDWVGGSILAPLLLAVGLGHLTHPFLSHLFS